MTRSIFHEGLYSLPAELQLLILPRLSGKRLKILAESPDFQELITRTELNEKIEIRNKILTKKIEALTLQTPYEICKALLFAGVGLKETPTPSRQTLKKIQEAAGKIQDSVQQREILLTVSILKEPESEIENSIQQCDTLLAVSTNLAKINHIEKALAILEKIKTAAYKTEDLKQRCMILLTVCTNQVKINEKKALETLEDAKNAARAIEESEIKRNALSTIAQFEMNEEAFGEKMATETISEAINTPYQSQNRIRVYKLEN